MGRCVTTTTWSIPLGGFPSPPPGTAKAGRGAARGPGPVRPAAPVVGPARRLPVPAVRHVEDVAAGDRDSDLVPVRPGVVVGRLRRSQRAALVQRDVTAGQPVEQGSGLVLLVGDEAVHRHRGVHDYLAHGALLCSGVPPKLGSGDLSLLYEINRPAAANCPTRG